MESGALRILLLTLGWMDLPKSVSVHGAGDTEILREPVPAVLVQTGAGWLLLDTGFNTALIRDPALRERFYPRPLERPLLPGPGEPLPDALAAHDLGLDDIGAVAVSHLHLDHAGGLKHFAGRVPVHVQRAELDYGLSGHPEPEHSDIFRIDFDDPRIDWRPADGDVRLAPGVLAVATPGHTPGHQSFAVELDPSVGGGGYLFAFDAADLTENIDAELPVGGLIGVRPEDSVRQIQRLKRIAAERGLRLVPGHDPVVWPELAAELDRRFGAR